MRKEIVVGALIAAAAFAGQSVQAQLPTEMAAVGTFYADIDGDRKADIIFQGIDNQFWLSLSTGEGFAAAQSVLKHGGPFNAAGTHIADVNGDGKADIIFQGIDNQFWLSLSKGAGFAAAQSVLKHGGPFNAAGTHMADVNGDGKADIIFQGIDNQFWLSLSTGAGFAAAQSVIKHGGPFNPVGTRVADVNGDGKADIIFQGIDNQFWLSLSTGAGFAAAQSVLKHGGPFNPVGTRVADINGDGKADIIFQGIDNQFWLSLSTGAGFAAAHPVLQHGGPFNAELPQAQAEAIRNQGDRCEKDCKRACRVIFSGVNFTEPTCKWQCEAEKEICRKSGLQVHKVLPPSPKEWAEKVGTQACTIGFETITKAVMVTACFANPAGSQKKIEAAKTLLIEKGLIPASEFNNVRIAFCRIAAEGITPNRNTIYLNEPYMERSDIDVAILLAHEMKHVMQYRAMKTDNFKCQYSKSFVTCGGCQDDRHPLEREAYDFEERAHRRLTEK